MDRNLLDNLTDQETEALEKLKSSLTGFLGNRLIKFVIYGSKARGDYDDESDIDIAIVAEGLTKKLKNQILDKVAEIEFEFLTPLSIFVLSEEEFKYLKRRERRIALDIEMEGKPL
jgi:predicted nucleotidyltransferase